MARMTKAQREWRPGMKKKARSIKVMFASTVLTLEALVAFFATLATFGLNMRAALSIKILIWVIGLIVALTAVASPAFLKKPWGYGLGWAIQAILILWGIFLPAMFFVGACFAIAYWYGLHAGDRVDRENVERAKAQEEWEKAHPEG